MRRTEWLRREYTLCIGDERVLGSSRFVEEAISQDEIEIETKSLRQRQGWDLDLLIRRVGGDCELADYQLLAKARGNRLAKAKSLICYWGTEELGCNLAEIASKLRISQQAVSKWEKKGRVYCELEKVDINDLAH